MNNPRMCAARFDRNEAQASGGVRRAQCRVVFVALGASIAALAGAIPLIRCASASETSASSASAPASQPSVRLGKVPAIKLDQSAAASAPTPQRIRKLVASLKEIDSPYYGLSPTLSGTAFAPIPALERSEAFLLTAHGLKTPDALCELVKLGPRALPFLLDALDDPTPTKLAIRDCTGFCTMWFANEVRGNPVNLAEQTALASVPTTRRSDDEDTGREHVDSYTIKVGDVCLVIVGQIVGRGYQALRYQPSGCIVLNSPTHDPALARQVRAVWASEHPAQHLLDSLLIDYSTEGIYNGESLDGWYEGSDLQIAAATRLLYYFPKQTSSLVADRLHRLQVHCVGPGAGSWHNRAEMEAATKRDLANGVRADEFVKAVAWCGEPVIRAELRRIFERTGDPDILLASLAGIDRSEAELISDRLQVFLDRLPADQGGPFGDGYNILVALGGRLGSRAKPAFVRYMQPGTIQRCRTMCHVLRKTQREWAIELLGPLLTDLRPSNGWTYAVKHGQNEPQLPIRICDEAAETISTAYPALRFEMVGEHKDLDRQIASMRERITTRPSPR